MPKDSGERRKRSMRAMENLIEAGHIKREVSCEAKRAYSAGGAAAARAALGKKRKSTKIYHCRFCGQYHLTGA